MSFNFTDEVLSKIDELREQGKTYKEIATAIDYPKSPNSLYNAIRHRINSQKEDTHVSLDVRISDLEKQIAKLESLKHDLDNLTKLRTFIDENDLSRFDISISNQDLSDLPSKMPRMVMPSENAQSSNDLNNENRSDLPSTSSDETPSKDITQKTEKETPKNDLQDDLDVDFFKGITVEWDEEGNIKINDPLVEAVRQAVDTGIDEEVIADALEITLEECYDIADWEEENDNKDFDNDDE